MSAVFKLRRPSKTELTQLARESRALSKRIYEVMAREFSDSDAPAFIALVNDLDQGAAYLDHLAVKRK